MNVLVDTNVLGRMAEPGHPQCQLALAATSALRTQGDTLCVVPQVLYEFWAVATRPVSANGLGFSVQEAAAELARVKSLFVLMFDTPGLYAQWEQLVFTQQITGKNAHDARLVAAMTVHVITHILTFNTGDFARFTGIVALDPRSMAPSSSP